MSKKKVEKDTSLLFPGVGWGCPGSTPTGRAWPRAEHQGWGFRRQAGPGPSCRRGLFHTSHPLVTGLFSLIFTHLLFWPVYMSSCLLNLVLGLILYIKKRTANKFKALTLELF